MKDDQSGLLARNIFVGLEELFDIRLAVLGDKYPDKIKDIIDAGYYNRERDEFEVVGLSYEDFKNLYKERNADHLTGSKRTHIVDMVARALRHFVEESILEPFRGIPTLRINSYPYLMDKEIQDDLSLYLQSFIGDNLPIAFDWVRLSPNEIDPKWLGKEHSIVFMYDCLEWMNIVGEKLSGSYLHLSEVILPGLFLDQPISDKVKLDDDYDIEIHPFEAIRILAKQFINLRFIPATFFSALSPDNPPAPPPKVTELRDYKAHMDENIINDLMSEHKHPIWDVAGEAFLEAKENSKKI